MYILNFCFKKYIIKQNCVKFKGISHKFEMKWNLQKRVQKLYTGCPEIKISGYYCLREALFHQ